MTSITTDAIRHYIMTCFKLHDEKTRKLSAKKIRKFRIIIRLEDGKRDEKVWMPN